MTDEIRRNEAIEKQGRVVEAKRRAYSTALIKLIEIVMRGDDDFTYLRLSRDHDLKRRKVREHV